MDFTDALSLAYQHRMERCCDDVVDTIQAAEVGAKHIEGERLTNPSARQTARELAGKLVEARNLAAKLKDDLQPSARPNVKITERVAPEHAETVGAVREVGG